MAQTLTDEEMHAVEGWGMFPKTEKQQRDEALREALLDANLSLQSAIKIAHEVSGE
jgi:ABC-type oligopeptide transport system ATPase subunit